MAATAPRRKGRPSNGGQQVGRDMIVTATKDLIMSHRSDRLTRAEVAKTLGIDQKLVRYYFPDFGALIDEALDLGVLDLDKQMAKASAKQDTQSQVLSNRLSALSSFLVQRPGYFRILVERIYEGSGEEAANRLVTMTKNAYRRHDKMVRSGQAAGEFKDFDPRLLYLAIIGLVDIFVTARPVAELLFADDTDNLSERYEAFVIDLILNGILQRPKS